MLQPICMKTRLKVNQMSALFKPAQRDLESQKACSSLLKGAMQSPSSVKAILRPRAVKGREALARSRGAATGKLQSGKTLRPQKYSH